MIYKHITISEDEIHNKRPMYSITNNKSGEKIGLIFYYPRWRQYVFTQYSDNIVFNKGCLTDIIDFIDNHAKTK